MSLVPFQRNMRLYVFTWIPSNPDQHRLEAHGSDLGTRNLVWLSTGEGAEKRRNPPQPRPPQLALIGGGAGREKNNFRRFSAGCGG
eukprot:774354-Prorocentrum_lima.AAC.1